MSEFEDLASMARYTVGNKETVNLFLKGFENAPNVLTMILAPSLISNYYNIKERAISTTKSCQLVNAIRKNTPEGFNTF